MKILDLKKNVYELVKEYPEIADILSGMGLSEVKKSAVLNSVGKPMTIPKGMKLRKMSLKDAIEKFRSAGFEIINIPDCLPNDEPSTPHCHSTTPAQNRTELLKSYLQRLNEGESLESVQADFAKSFRSVDASEIMKAEQEMLHEGTPLRRYKSSVMSIPPSSTIDLRKRRSRNPLLLLWLRKMQGRVKSCPYSRPSPTNTDS